MFLLFTVRSGREIVLGIQRRSLQKYKRGWWIACLLGFPLLRSWAWTLSGPCRWNLNVLLLIGTGSFKSNTSITLCSIWGRTSTRNTQTSWNRCTYGFRLMGVFKLWVLQWLRILDCIFSAYCAHRAILIKMVIFEAILLMNSYEIWNFKIYL